MSEIEEAVKQAIERQIGDEGIVAQDGYSVKVDAWLDLDVIARVAIDAYEAAKVVKVWPTAYYFNGIPVSDLNREQQEEYLAYMKKLAARL